MSRDAACNPRIRYDSMTLYVANFLSNSISAFDVREDGTLMLLGTTKRRGAAGPDTKDVVLSRDGRMLYAVASQAREVSIYRIGQNRLPVELPEGMSPVKLGSGQNTTGLAAD